MFYQNAGNIHLSERDNAAAAKCRRIGARTLKDVDTTKAAILYMDSCELLFPTSGQVEFIPPTAAGDFYEGLKYLLSVPLATPPAAAHGDWLSRSMWW